MVSTITTAQKGSDKKNVYQSPFGYPQWDLLIGLYIGWLVITLMTLKGMRTLAKIICVSGLIPLVLLMALIFLNANSFSLKTYIKIFAFIPIDSLIDLQLWISAACYSAKSMAISLGVLSCLCSYNK